MLIQEELQTLLGTDGIGYTNMARWFVFGLLGKLLIILRYVRIFLCLAEASGNGELTEREGLTAKIIASSDVLRP